MSAKEYARNTRKDGAVPCCSNDELRIIFRNALESKAVSIMVAHNHPSGSLKASLEDKELTRRIAEGGKVLDIKLKDHIIVAIGPNGKTDYFSFHDNGYL